MNIQYSTGIREYPGMTTRELRSSFLLEGLFTPGKIDSTYWETDRAVVSSIVPTGTDLVLAAEPELAAHTFFERREAGILNLGGPGRISVGGVVYDLGEMDCLYLGKGSADPSFSSKDPARPQLKLTVFNCRWTPEFISPARRAWLRGQHDEGTRSGYCFPSGRAAMFH